MTDFDFRKMMNTSGPSIIAVNEWRASFIACRN